MENVEWKDHCIRTGNAEGQSIIYINDITKISLYSSLTNSNEILTNLFLFNPRMFNFTSQVVRLVILLCYLDLVR